MLKLDYTKKDYASLLEETKIAIRTQFPEWTDFLDSDIGFAIIKTAVAVADVNHFYLDRQAAEAYLDTAEERANVVAMAKSLGYTPKESTPARVIVDFSLTAPYNENIVVPQYTSITVEGKEFITEEEGVILAGSNSTKVQCVQGSFFKLTSKATGEPFFKINVPISVTEVEIFVGEEKWEPTPSFLVRPDNPNSYRIYEDRDRKVVMFGSVLYTTPSNQTDIVVTGIQTSGVSGNTRYKNSPVTIASPIYNANNQNINNLLSAVTLGAAIGGSDSESTDSIKKLAPGVYSTQNRVVTANDYRYMALTVPGVAEASAWGGELINRYGEVYVCVISNYANTGLESLVELVKAKLNPIKMLSMQLKVIPAEEVFLDLQFSGTVKRQINEFGLQGVVVTAIQGYFATLAIGQDFQFSDLIAHLQSVAQLDHYMVTHSVRSKGNLNSNEFVANRTKNAIYDNAQIIDADGNPVWTKNSSNSLVTNDQQVIVPGVNSVNGTYQIVYNSSSVDVFVQPYHKIRLGKVAVSLLKAQA